jgi:hypothetical protein
MNKRFENTLDYYRKKSADLLDEIKKGTASNYDRIQNDINRIKKFPKNLQRRYMKICTNEG